MSSFNSDLLNNLDGIISAIQQYEPTEGLTIKNIARKVFQLFSYRNELTDAHDVIHYYLDNAKECEKNHATTQKIVALYDILISKNGMTVQDIDPSKIETMRNWTTSQLLFHLQADEFGKNSEFEGMTTKEPLGYVLRYFEARSDNGMPISSSDQEIIEQLETAYAISIAENKQEAIHEAIEKAFETGKPLLIPGGWVGLPAGHAIYYEMIPQKNGTGSLRVFNTGEGIQEHPRALSGVKEKVGFAEWTGVQKERFLDPYFAQSIAEMDSNVFVPGLDGVKTDYTFHDIYYGLKALLGVADQCCLNEKEALEIPLMQPQRAGTCAYRSLSAFLKSKMTPSEFRRYKCDVRIQSLSTYILQHQQEISTKQSWRLVEKSARQLSRKVEKLFHDKIIDQRYFETAYAELKEILKWVKKKRPVVFRKDRFKVRQGYLTFAHASPGKEIEGPLASTSIAKLEEMGKQGATSHLMQKVQTFDLTNPSTIAQEVKELRRLLSDAYRDKEYEAVNFSIIEIAKKLPLESNFWKKVSGERNDSQSMFGDRSILFKGFFSGKGVSDTKKVTESMINDWNALSEMFFKSCYRIPHPNRLFDEKIYALSKLYFVQNSFAEQFVPSLQLQPPPLFWGDKEHMQSHDEKMQNEWYMMKKESRTSLKESGKVDPFENEVIYVYFRRELFVDFSSGYGNDSSSNQRVLSEIIKNEYPAVLDEIRRLNPNFDEMESIEQEMVIYIHPGLPIWMKGFRDMKLRIDILEKDFVHFQDREEASLNFMFKIGNKKVFVDLEGRERPNEEILMGMEDSEPSGFSDALIPIQDSNLKEIISRRGASEKDLLSQNYQGVVANLSDTELKEILHIFCENSNSPLEAVAYFSRFPEKLQNHDYQQVFQKALFSKIGYGLNKVDKPAIYLGRLLVKRLEYCEGEKDIKTSVFLLRMVRYCHHFSAGKEVLPDEEVWLKRLLANPEITFEEKSMVYAEQAALLGEQTSLAGEKIKELLVATSWVSQMPIPEKWCDPKTEWLMGRALHVHSAEIVRLVSQGNPNNSLLNEIYKEVGGETLPSHWKITSKKGESLRVTSSNGDLYDPLKGRMISINAQVHLPIEIRESPSFYNLFPTQVKATALEGDLYQFKDKLGNIVVVKKNEEGVVIEQKREGRWYRYIGVSELTILDKKNVISRLESRDLVNHTDVWQLLDDSSKFVLLDKVTNKPVYEVAYISSTTQDITRLSDGAKLSSPSSMFAHIEDKGYIHEWYDENKQSLKEVELPRFALNFKVDNGRLECTQYPGWYVAEDQTFLPLGSCEYWLKLVGPKGEKKILIPDQKLKKPEEKFKVLLPKIERDQALENGIDRQFEHRLYDVDAKGKLSSKSREGYLYLVGVLAAHQEYALAAEYLREHGEKLSDYTEKEKEYLKRIYQVDLFTGDTSGEQKAIALYAANLLATNPVQSDEAKKILPDLYDGYLKSFQNVTALRLTRNEEMKLLKNLAAKDLKPSYLVRLRELDPDYASQLEAKMIENEIPPKPKKVRSLLSNLNLPKIVDPPLTEEVEEQALLTRSGGIIKKYFFDYFRMAISGTDKQKEWIHKASIYLSNQLDIEAQALGRLFQYIRRDPNSFTEPPKAVHGVKEYKIKSKAKRDVEEWWEATLAMIPEDDLITPKGKKAIIGNITPDSFRLEKENAPLPAIEFSYSLTEVEPLSVDSSLYDPIPTKKEKNHELMEMCEKKASEKENPLLSQEWERLVSDLEAFESKPSKPTQKLKAPLDEIKKMIEAGVKEESDEMRSLEIEMLFHANKLPENRTERFRYEMQKWGGLQKEISLDDIFVSFAQGNPKILQELNRGLISKEIQNLYSMAADYLMLSSRQQQRKRCLVTWEKLKADPENIELEVQLASELQDTRQYDPSKHPAYLVFEHFSEIIMRPEQVEKLEIFLSGKDPNPIMEMIMGSGKSKVLLPLLGLLRADGKNLSMVLVGQPFFESVSSDTQEILKGGFGKVLRTLHFDRNSTFTKRSLEEIRDSLKEIIEEKETLIMTAKGLESLMLKFIEHTNEMIQRGRYLDEEVTLMTDIIRIFKASGYPLIDEADTLLNVLHEVSFSLGEKLPPRTKDLHILGQLYHLLYTDPKLKAIGKIESDPEPDELAPPLTEEIYQHQLKRSLAEAFLAKLEREGIGDHKIDRELKSYTRKHKANLVDYLCGKIEMEKFYETIPKNIKEVFELANDEITSFLPHTLFQIEGENYGLGGGNIAIPYSAVNTPSYGSLHAKHFITMNYTIQSHIKNGIGRELIKKAIQTLKKQADQEIAESGDTIRISETKAWEKFCCLRGDFDIPFRSELNDAHLHTIEKRINRSVEAKLNIVKEIFLPQLSLYAKKISCNSMALFGLCPKNSGFTGTLWNSRSMHRSATPLPEKGTDARTISLLWNMCSSADSVQTIPKGYSNEFKDFDLISDAGGYFKEGGNFFIAKEMALKFGKSVVFYNERGEQSITDGHTVQPLSESKLKEGERLTFLDQSHTTGADVVQRRDAVGYVTIGRNMLLRDILQSVWRLRGLEKGQSVRFLIDTEVEKIIRQKLNLKKDDKIGFPHILEFVVRNQSKRLGEDHVIAFKQQIWEMPQGLLLAEMIRTDISPEERVRIFQLLSETWIQPVDLLPSGQLKKEQKGLLVLVDEAKQCKEVLRRIWKSTPRLEGTIKKYIRDVNSLIVEFEKIVPPTMHGSPEGSSTMEIEQKSQQQIEMDVEMKTQSATQKKSVKLGYYRGFLFKKVDEITAEMLYEFDSFSGEKPLISLEHQMREDPELEPYSSLFKGIDISINVLEWEEGEIDPSKLKLLGTHRTPFHHLYLEGNEVQLKALEEFNASEDENYYNLYLGYNDPSRKPTKKAFEKIVKLKFLNGESTYSKKELEFLENWIQEAGGDKMQHFFESIILRGQPDHVTRYQNSALRRLFRKVVV